MQVLLDGLDDVLFFPINGFITILEELYKYAENELYDESRIRQELVNLHFRHEAGEVEEDYYKERQSVLLKRLNAAREYHSKIRGK
ncbi:MAG: gas vesicle protein GvpG [Firmicutes bacterium]|nr:gas vesicle protein GvpG [Bacillota bacterium]